jgi:hypothetical protein
MEMPLPLNRKNSLKRKSVKRKSVKRKSVKRKSVKRKSVKRKSVKRKSVKRKSVKRKSVKIQKGGNRLPPELMMDIISRLTDINTLSNLCKEFPVLCNDKQIIKKAVKLSLNTNNYDIILKSLKNFPLLIKNNEINTHISKLIKNSRDFFDWAEKNIIISYKNLSIPIDRIIYMSKHEKARTSPSSYLQLAINLFKIHYKNEDNFIRFMDDDEEEYDIEDELSDEEEFIPRNIFRMKNNPRKTYTLEEILDEWEKYVRSLY